MASRLAKHKRKLKVGFLLFSLSLALLLVEFATRILLPAYHPSRQILFSVNEKGVRTGEPGATVRQRTPKGDYDVLFTFNRYGFRDKEDFADASPNDWYLVGDSFGMGWGLEEDERFSSVLSELLSKPVYNLSIPTDIVGYRKLLDYAVDEGASVSNLLVSVCMENDFRDYARDHPQQADQETRIVENQLKARIRAWLKTHSAFYLLLSYKLQSVDSLRGLMEKIGISRTVDDQLLNRNTFDEEALRYSAEKLEEVIRDADRSVVLLIPSRALWVADNIDIEKKVHDYFVSELTRRGIQYVDMRPVFEAAGNPMSFYFETDPHWNAKGHTLAAEELSESISSKVANP